ncbi:MAG: glycosyltransferase [Rubripirellula sp.]|nr:glycosyltransferase [Rubripirellula sp.]
MQTTLEKHRPSEDCLVSENEDLHVFQQRTTAKSSVDVSVVVPVYNGEKDIEECLAKIQCSRDCSFEIVVANDASTDRTAEIAERMGARVITLEEQSGPAAARNHAISACRGDLIVFVDCDVRIAENTLQQFQTQFEKNDWVAAFGSYDQNPKAGNLVSTYKNLMHHFFHQRSAREAQTFWSGCGAVKKSVFEQTGGFNEQFARPSIEDIEFGMRLKEAGRPIGSLPHIQVQHTKRWTLRNLVYTDVFLRGIPWTRLMLRAGNLQNDLNVSGSQRACVFIAGLIVVALALVAWFQPAVILTPIPFIALLQLADCPEHHRGIRRYARWLVAMLLPLLTACCIAWQPLLAVVFLGVFAIGLINHASLRFLMNVNGIPFAILCLPLHVIYYIYCGFSFAAGNLYHLFGKPFFTETQVEQDAQMPELA